ncbi:MAG: isoprenylcysteine carboxylmethyltransferase family protein [Desulfobacterales bacterium]
MKSKIAETLIASLGTLFFLFLIIPFFLIWIPRRILLSPEHIYRFDIGVYQYFGLAPIVLGVAIYILCSGSFVFIGKGTPIPFTPTKELIVTGLYRFVRNPLYIAGVLVLAGETILFQSVGIFIYCLVMFGVFNVHVLMEETLLAEKFGARYEQYCKSVPRWIPRLNLYRKKDIESK